MNLFNDHLNLSNNIYDNAKILKTAEINKQQELVNRNPTTKYYQTLALNLQEQVQYLRRQLNEAEAIVDPTVIQRADNIPNNVDRSYQDRDTGQWTDGRGKPISGSPSGPNYNWPLGQYGENVDLNNPNLTEKDFFPPGLGPGKPPKASDYAGGVKNDQYQRDLDAWEEALQLWDRWVDTHGGG